MKKIKSYLDYVDDHTHLQKAIFSCKLKMLQIPIPTLEIFVQHKLHFRP